MNEIVKNPSIVWALGTLLAFVSISVYAGIKLGLLLFGIWLVGSIVVYFIRLDTN